MVEPQTSKLITRVRFSSSPPLCHMGSAGQPLGWCTLLDALCTVRLARLREVLCERQELAERVGDVNLGVREQDDSLARGGCADETERGKLVHGYVPLSEKALTFRQARRQESPMTERILIERSDSKWGCSLEAGNGRVIAADGSQGYNNEDDARDMADRTIGGEL